jgi:hypothetical protein
VPTVSAQTNSFIVQYKSIIYNIAKWVDSDSQEQVLQKIYAHLEKIEKRVDSEYKTKTVFQQACGAFSSMTDINTVNIFNSEHKEKFVGAAIVSLCMGNNKKTSVDSSKLIRMNDTLISQSQAVQYLLSQEKTNTVLQNLYITECKKFLKYLETGEADPGVVFDYVDRFMKMYDVEQYVNQYTQFIYFLYCLREIFSIDLSADGGVCFDNGKRMKVDVVRDVARTKYLIDSKKSILTNPLCRLTTYKLA